MHRIAVPSVIAVGSVMGIAAGAAIGIDAGAANLLSVTYGDLGRAKMILGSDLPAWTLADDSYPVVLPTGSLVSGAMHARLLPDPPHGRLRWR